MTFMLEAYCHPTHFIDLFIVDNLTIRRTTCSILPNIGMFHYCQTAMRSYLKLMWNIELEDLAKSIGLESPKALFCFQNGTNFRMSFDLIRQARSANLREMLYPYVQHCFTENLTLNVEGFIKCRSPVSISKIEKKIYNTKTTKEAVSNKPSVNNSTCRGKAFQKALRTIRKSLCQLQEKGGGEQDFFLLTAVNLKSITIELVENKKNR